jgi:VanZ family protein
MNLRLALALGCSAIVVLTAPVVGQLRGAIQSAMPGEYRLILGGIVGGAVVGSVGVALWRIRERRRLRYSLLAAAVIAGVAYSSLTATGNANVDAVERFHFVEYGLLTLLFYRAWRHRADLAMVLLPLAAVLTVGTLDEGVQWFVPGRVGEWRDVLLNGAAIVCGLLFGLGLDPPVALTTRLDRSGRIVLARVGAAAVVVAALFFHTVHLGYEIHDPDTGFFRSRFSADELREAARDRSMRWRTDPPTTLRRLSREDQYLAEGLWHVQRRNEVESVGGAWAQWNENLILEKYFAPVLEFPTYTTPSGARWPPAQREQVRAAAEVTGTGPDAGAVDPDVGDAFRRPAVFISDANPFPIYTWSRVTFWVSTLTVLGVLFACLRLL